MSWKIEFYDKKVKENINQWPEKMVAKFLWLADVIEKFGPTMLGMPHFILHG